VWPQQATSQANGSPPKAKAGSQADSVAITADKVHLVEATAEIAKLRSGLHTKEQEKAVLQLQLQQQDFTVKKMSSDLSRHKLDLHKASDMALAAKDRQIEQLEDRLRQNDSAVLQLYGVLQQQQQQVAARAQSEKQQNHFKLLDPEVLAKIKGTTANGTVSRDDHMGQGRCTPKGSAAAAAAASFVTHHNKAAGQVNCYTALCRDVGFSAVSSTITVRLLVAAGVIVSVNGFSEAIASHLHQCIFSSDFGVM